MKPFLFLTLALFSVGGLSAAELKVADVFSDHAVLQRDQAVPVWGTAEAGSQITVEFAGQTQSTTADAQGYWRVKLAPLKASAEPRDLKINDVKNPANSLLFKDILVGEVWVGSGQSNMAMLLHHSNDPYLAKNAKGSYPQLRLLRQGAGQKWEAATPESISHFSVMLFSFGLPLHQQLQLPIGLMVGAVGSTPSGNWLSEEMYRADSACAAQVKKFAATYDYPREQAKYADAKKKYDDKAAQWNLLAEAAKKEGKTPPSPPRPPAPAVLAGECNHDKIGSLFETYIRHYVGYGIRGVLWDQGEGGTAIVGVDQYTLMGALIRGWREAWGQGDFPFLYIQKPSGGGPAWDYSDPVTEKADKFAELPGIVPTTSADGYTHPHHLKIMNYPNTFMVTSTDLGSGTHPVNKSGYGLRGAHVAMNTVYGGKAEYYGPLYAGHEIKDDKVILRFTHIGQGLAFKNGNKLQGFALAGSDGNFVWADAVIEGKTVVVSAPAIPHPVHVRYAWATTFPWANLFNQDGLPAQPFTTEP